MPRVNDIELPQELLDQLGGQRKPRPLSAHDYVLKHIASNDGIIANDLLIYLWVMTGKVTKREYLYHVLSRLRLRGLIRTESGSVPMKATHFITPEGKAQVAETFKRGVPA